MLAALVVAGVMAGACSSGDDTEGAAGDDGAATDGAAGEEIFASTHPDAESLEVVEPPEQPGVETLQFKFGPIAIEPGQNNIDYSGLDIPKPEVDGYIVSITPDLVREDGTVPPVDVIHLHHGVWANVSATREERETGGGLAQLFFAAGEEKTRMTLPAGYGYEYEANDRWIINYMIHNLLSTPDEVWVTYEIGFIPKTAPEAADIKVAHPLWMDVQKGNIYPVFDVQKGSGTDGTFTYPDEADNPYGDGEKLNEWVADRDVTLIAAGGHLHPGGHQVDLWLNRESEADRAHVLQSDAVYYEPAGAVSWDVSMTVTPEDWRIDVDEGDVLSISTTYDTERASWYESMGITVVWLVDGHEGVDPFTDPVDPQDTVLTHGHLPENDNHGGEPTDEFVDATELADGPPADRVTIADFTYAPGDIGGIYDNVPTVAQGGRLTFYNEDAPIEPNGIWHTITACAAPCNDRTGVAYPLADAEVQFDSGELGVAGPPTAGRLEWDIPTSLEPGTYTYFCRIHPSMRGAFRVVD
ncbi:MAG TPA: hypothetical protein VK611_30395 [Acidimicrobiales bacterium]|nr:hypothetical protein [Acidimicrobiales bacterium]